MTAPDRAAAVEVVRRVLDESSVGPSMTAEDVVAALDTANQLRRPDEAAYVAALKAVAEAARGLLLLNAPGRAWDEQMRSALDAVPAAETGRPRST